MQNINQVLQADFLPKLIQIDNFVGWTYAVDYEYAFVMTNDLWKFKAIGIPHNCFLVATATQPDTLANTPEEDREIILLRVIREYNSGWGIARYRDGKILLELVCEIKGREEIKGLRFPQKERRIQFAQKHFYTVSVEYRIVPDEIADWWISSNEIPDQKDFL